MPFGPEALAPVNRLRLAEPIFQIGKDHAKSHVAGRELSFLTGESVKSVSQTYDV